MVKFDVWGEIIAMKPWAAGSPIDRVEITISFHTPPTETSIVVTTTEAKSLKYGQKLHMVVSTIED
jgi:hypothetical protein